MVSDQSYPLIRSIALGPLNGASQAKPIKDQMLTSTFLNRCIAASLRPPRETLCVKSKKNFGSLNESTTFASQ